MIQQVFPQKSYKPSVYLPTVGLVCALGSSRGEIIDNLFEGKSNLCQDNNELLLSKNVKVARVKAKLPEIPLEFKSFNIRSNQLLLAAYLQIANEVNICIQKYGNDRVAVVLGSGTSGIDEGQQAVNNLLQEGHYPEEFNYLFLEMGLPALFLAKYLGLTNACYSVSTACSSSAKVFSSARNLLQMGICDAVLVGGTDSLCKLTLRGFDALEAVSADVCNPFSCNRNGITLGEGAALFLMTKEDSDFELLGIGESSDAYHTTSPDPTGSGATLAMQKALREANLQAEEIDYLNLHGTGTQANDLIESKAVNFLFGEKVFCSSTKQLTGHTLGAAGAIELALCWLVLSGLNEKSYLPQHIWDEQIDPALAKINLVKKNKNKISARPSICMSNSFAFGGSNASLIIGRKKI